MDETPLEILMIRRAAAIKLRNAAHQNHHTVLERAAHRYLLNPCSEHWNSLLDTADQCCGGIACPVSMVR